MDPYAYKYEATRELLATHTKVKVICDGRHPDVDLPSHLWEDPKVELQLGRGTRARDLRIHPVVGISGTLSFAGVPHHCLLPWSAIYVIGSHVWFGEIPADARKHFPPGPCLRSTLKLLRSVDQPPPPPGDGPHAA